MNNFIFNLAFAIGALVVIWMGANFVGSDSLALAMIALIGIVYIVGFVELKRFRSATHTLSHALNGLVASGNDQSNKPELSSWLSQLHHSLQNPVRLRIEGERVGLPAPVLSPYLVGLLVMLGLLGTFAGMVGTLKGAVFALEGTTELQAIREGLAAPMKGLGLAFGTSVAGVAASAMLGLLSTMSRRERMTASRDLDSKIATVLKEYSLTHHRQETYKALQGQAEALPAVAEQLQALAVQMEKMGDHLANRLLDNQLAFQDSTRQLFEQLATSVDQSLKQSLSDSGRMAGDSIKPIVSEVMTGLSDQISRSASETHEQLATVAHTQFEQLSERFNGTTTELLNAFEGHSKNWFDQAEASDAARAKTWSKAFEEAQGAATNVLNETCQSLVNELKDSVQQQQASVKDVSNDFNAMVSQLTENWQGASEQMSTQQAQILERLIETADSMSETQKAGTNQLLEEVAGLLSQSEALVSARMATEEQWLSSQQDRMTSLTESLKTELGQLRDDESRRGNEAIERLGKLEETVSTHLATLGQSLEEPMTRLIETASETPKAAAEVIGQLREEISNNIARDNQLLEERRRIMDDLNTLFATMEQTSTGQRDAIEQLVTSSAETLNTVGSQFTNHVSGEVTRLNDIADHFATSSAEMASLGDAFGTAVTLFHDANQQMIDSLNRIESALEQSSSRSDEQLGYYVAQAREIIDHSMMSQREIFDELRQLGAKAAQAQPAEEVV